MSLNSGVAPAELPVLPSLKGRAMAVLWNPSADLRDFISIVEGDPGLTASVLRATRASFAAPSGPIGTAAGALDQIGIEATRQIVTAAFTRSEFEHLNRSDVHLEDFWTWQLAVGLLAECFCLADRRPAAEVESAFTVGLIHQVGRLSLIARSPDRYREVVGLATSGTDPLEAEWQILGDDAAHVTQQVAIHWGLPEPFPSALTARPDPAASGLPLLLREAREVAALLGFNEGFSLEVPARRVLPADHPRASQLAAIGGLEELTRQVEWFHRASGARTPLAARPSPVSDDVNPADRIAS